MHKRRLMLAGLLGVLIGTVATYVLTPRTDNLRFAEVVTPDMPEVVDISVAEAEVLREDRYETITTIEETLALPTDFAETEALYIIAGRSNSAEVQDLIYQAAKVRDRTDRRAALEILFLRLTEMDPLSALAIARSPALKSDGGLETSVWAAWGRLDLVGALEFAATGTTSEKRRTAQALYRAVRGLENEDARLIESMLGQAPGRDVKVQHLYALADISAGDAIRYIESLPTVTEQREQFGWLAPIPAKRRTC